LKELGSISLSKLPDNFFCLHVPSEYVCLTWMILIWCTLLICIALLSVEMWHSFTGIPCCCCCCNTYIVIVIIIRYIYNTPYDAMLLF
jgi:hypothetical protein